MVDYMMSFMCCLSQCPTIRACSFADSLVSRARNIAVAGFLKTDAEYLLFWDADIVAMPQDLAWLCENDHDILCGIYPKKQLDLVPVFQTLPGHEATAFGGIIEVSRSGTGFMRVHRSVFQSMIDSGSAPVYTNHGEDQWDFFPVGVRDGEYLSEDWLLCDLARSLGFKVMLDTRIQLRHQGLATYPIAPAAAPPSPLFIPKSL
jgi:hypothetical protein